MRILIIGGTGFIGSKVVAALHAHEIAVVHRGQSCRGSVECEHIHLARNDLTLHRARLAAFRPDVVLDMLAQNASDAQCALAAVVGLARRLVMVSSASVYRAFGVMLGSEPGEIDNRLLGEEMPLRNKLYPYRGPAPRLASDPRRWLDDYDKIPAERLLREQSEIEWGIVRLPMVYGPGDYDRRLGPYLRRMRDRRGVIALQRSVAGWRNSKAYVGNVATAIARIVERAAPATMYNVAEPAQPTEAEWIRRLGGVVGWQGEVVTIPDGGEVGRPSIDEFPKSTRYEQHLRLSSDRIRQELAYTEGIALAAALETTVEAALLDLPSVDYRLEDARLTELGLRA